jgi:alpha-methylacyl-CoA racemase
MTEAPSDPHLAARGTFVTTGGVLQPAPAPRFDSAADGAPVGALPAGAIAPVGAHTRAVLTELGFADVEELLSGGAVWQA